jgi:hypothetical protein
VPAASASSASPAAAETTKILPRVTRSVVRSEQICQRRKLPTAISCGDQIVMRSEVSAGNHILAKRFIFAKFTRLLLDYYSVIAVFSEASLNTKFVGIYWLWQPEVFVQK